MRNRNNDAIQKKNVIVTLKSLHVKQNILLLLLSLMLIVMSVLILSPDIVHVTNWQ